MNEKPPPIWFTFHHYILIR